MAESSRSGASQSSGSNRGSLDLLRMTTTEESSEVEVLVHHVSRLQGLTNWQIKPAESLAGIALLYGIDVSESSRIRIDGLVANFTKDQQIMGFRLGTSSNPPIRPDRSL